MRGKPVQFAFDDFWRIANSRKGDPALFADKEVQYLAALVADLAYYHVPEFEIDDDKRTKLVPSSAYQSIVAAGVQTSVVEALERGDFGDPFVIQTAQSVTVAMRCREEIFVGIRGTKFMFDWKINFNAEINEHGFHSGFYDEAVSVALRLRQMIPEIADPRTNQKLVLTGHSLGGAIASCLASVAYDGCRIIRCDTSCIVFGSPRYRAKNVGWSTGISEIPVHLRREQDMVPTVPRRKRGFVDYPLEEFVSEKVSARRTAGTLASLGRWGRFIGSRFADHAMEAYRFDCGRSAEIDPFLLPLIDRQKLVRRNLQGP